MIENMFSLPRHSLFSDSRSRDDRLSIELKSNIIAQQPLHLIILKRQFYPHLLAYIYILILSIVELSRIEN